MVDLKAKIWNLLLCAYGAESMCHMNVMRLAENHWILMVRMSCLLNSIPLLVALFILWWHWKSSFEFYPGWSHCLSTRCRIQLYVLVQKIIQVPYHIGWFFFWQWECAKKEQYYIGRVFLWLWWEETGIVSIFLSSIMCGHIVLLENDFTFAKEECYFMMHDLGHRSWFSSQNLVFCVEYLESDGIPKGKRWTSFCTSEKIYYSAF